MLPIVSWKIVQANRRIFRLRGRPPGWLAEAPRLKRKPAVCRIYCESLSFNRNNVYYIPADCRYSSNRLTVPMLRQKQVKLAFIVLGVWLMLAALFAALPSLSALLSTVYVQENSRAIGVVRVESNQPGVLEISWDAPAETPLDYRVSWARVGESFPSRPDDPGNAYPTSPSYMSMGLDQGVRYQVQVRARYEDADGDWSAPVEAVVASAPASTATPAPAAALPAPPRSLRAEVTHNSVLLSWSTPEDNGDSVSGYQILRRDRAVDPVDQFTILAEDTGSSATYYVDSTVLPDGRYTYRVRALNGTVLGSGFAQVDANTLSVPPAPTATPTAVPAPAAAAISAAAPTATTAPTAVLPPVPLQGIETPAPISEKDALIAVYHAAGGANWALRQQLVDRRAHQDLARSDRRRKRKRD